jgi:hypothetical protein
MLYYLEVVIIDVNLHTEEKRIPSLNHLHDLFHYQEGIYIPILMYILVIRCPFCSKIVNLMLQLKFLVGN